MRAMVLAVPGPIGGAPLRLVELPEPRPGPGQVRLRVEACAVCHTDLHVVEGELPARRLPVVPGHQVVGVVDAVGPRVTRFRPGDHAGIPWLHEACGSCRHCRREAENLCEAARFTGYDVDGGYAEAMLASAEFALPLPKEQDALHLAPLLCAGIIGYRALRLSGVGPGDRLGLYGFGASAHLVLQMARHLGCIVCVFTRGAEHRRLALDLGAAWAGGLAERPRELLQAGIVFAPAGEIVPLGLAALDRGGTLVLAGIYMSTVPALDYREHLYHEKRLLSVANATRGDAGGLLRLAAEASLKPEIEVFGLEEANTALQRLKEGRIQGAGVLRVR